MNKPLFAKLSPKLLLLVFALILTSFSSGKRTKLNIVFIGDSITEGGALKQPALEATPLIVQQILSSNGQFTSVDVANRGFSGHTSLDFLPTTNTDFPKVIEAANNFNKDTSSILLFSIMLGTNDSAIFGPNGSPISADQYDQNMSKLIDALSNQYPKAKFVLQYPLWYSTNTQNNAAYLEEGLNRLESYFPKIDNLVKKYKKIAPGRIFAGDKSGFNFFRKNHTTLFKPEQGKKGTFYLHPNAEGSKELARIWSKGILKAI
ncbi:lipolytic protein G-D-S-L family [Pedobacter ginsengisoli]|uniref:Lipolytic protein G-D-S-L family n=1 Tax=Pedobacter ginsengisoli TaxID=363852 RepID=A0A2D1U403_9SPHI|nr:GDSL-type esterase/lipase family protein [Pedobacter ginsengisoli]ATP56337.1 lipolytic protein G-D-S-L family [Pedobacter ginsengisoli]